MRYERPEIMPNDSAANLVAALSNQHRQKANTTCVDSANPSAYTGGAYELDE
jgi:hypothetical protein